jgi:hypothetical protein
MSMKNIVLARPTMVAETAPIVADRGPNDTD